jgi:hypothetical protein
VCTRMLYVYIYIYIYIYIYLGPLTGTCCMHVCVYCVAVCTQYTITQCGGAHSTATHGIIYIYVYMLLCSAAWRATSGRWASRRAAHGRTPRRAADRWAFLRALHYGWTYILALWGKEDTEEDAVPWELRNIKFQVG